MSWLFWLKWKLRLPPHSGHFSRPENMYFLHSVHVWVGEQKERSAEIGSRDWLLWDNLDLLTKWCANPFYGFSYDPQLDAFICPEGVPLTYHRLNCSKSTGKYLRCYQVEGDACMRCPKRPSCFDKAGIRRRVLASSCYPAFFRGHQRVGTPEYLAMMRLRKIWAEGSFSVLKREHCISKIRKRGILAATEECCRHGPKS